MPVEPVTIVKLSEIHGHILGAVPVGTGAVRFNTIHQFQFDYRCVHDDLDLVRLPEAREWQQLAPNSFLYFTHGQYANRDCDLLLRENLALDHIVNELRNKPTSRRALFSLLFTGDIVETGDKPIPSLVLFQCGLSGRNLLATSYFRSLEAHYFLPINIAEFAIWVRYLHDHHVNFDSVTWTIHAFQAYADLRSNCLRRPEAASYRPAQLCDIASRRDYARLKTLLSGFAFREAYLCSQSFEWLCDAIRTFLPESPLIPGLAETEGILRSIVALTTTHSFGEELERQMGAFAEKIEQLAVLAGEMGDGLD